MALGGFLKEQRQKPHYCGRCGDELWIEQRINTQVTDLARFYAWCRSCGTPKEVAEVTGSIKFLHPNYDAQSAADRWNRYVDGIPINTGRLHGGKRGWG